MSDQEIYDLTLGHVIRFLRDPHLTADELTHVYEVVKGLPALRERCRGAS